MAAFVPHFAQFFFGQMPVFDSGIVDIGCYGGSITFFNFACGRVDAGFI